jgi:hypothetical protein
MDPECRGHHAALGRRALWGVDLLGREEYPRHPGVFMGQRDHGPVRTSPFDQGTAPATSAVMLELGPPTRRPSSVDEELTQLAIPPFADPQQPRLAPGGVLTWDKPQPCRQLPAIVELRHLIDRGD